MAEITRDGVVQKSFESYLKDIQDDWRTTFGDNMTFGAETPQGQITSLLALMMSEYEGQIVDVARSLDIAQAQGQQLDDLTTLLSITRRNATGSSVSAELTGAVGTKIPAGSLASLNSGEVFALENDVVIPASLLAQGFFVAVDAGATNVDPNTLTVITTPVIGWEGVDNQYAGTTGTDLESDSDLTRRYYAELFINSQSLMESIVAGVRAVDGVVTASGAENDTEDLKVIKGVHVSSHGFVVVAEGGGSTEIAEEIHKYKSVGSNSQRPCLFKITAGATGATFSTGTSVILQDADNLDGGSVTFRMVGEHILASNEEKIILFHAVVGDNISFADSVSLTVIDPDMASAVTEYAQKFVCVLLEVLSPSGDFVMQEVPIDFLRVVNKPVEISMTLATNRLWPTNGIDQVKDAIVAYFEGSDIFTDKFELNGLEIAEDLQRSRLYTPINSVQGHRVNALSLDLLGDGGNHELLEANLNEKFTITKDDISITVS